MTAEEGKPLEIKSSVVLIVEGKDDERFFLAFSKSLNITNIQIITLQGKNNLRYNLLALVKTPNFNKVRSLGIVIDADENAEATFTSVCNALKHANLPVPKRPSEPTDKYPLVVVKVLPNDNEPGTLEDLCLKAVANDPAMPCLENYFCCLGKRGLPLDSNTAKAKIQAFLASRPKAGKRIGEAAEAGYWPWNSPVFEPLAEFLKTLFQTA